MSESLPTLWHLEVSHFSEKARWALAHKEIAHRRRGPVPGVHIPVALFLTRGSHATFPILQLDGRTIGDSTAVIAALEERHPQPALYPADPEQRHRALELEDFFDEEVGPRVRLFAFYQLRQDPERFEALIERTAPPPMAKMPKAAAAYARAFTKLRFKVDDPEAAELAGTKILAAFDRLEEELGEGDYLVGDRFTVADLTAASLLNPIVLPDDGPIPNEQPPPRGLAEFREPLLDRPGFRWVDEMYRRHRKPAQAAAPTAA